MVAVFWVPSYVVLTAFGVPVRVIATMDQLKDDGEPRL
jgi:hypothetical protein